MQHTCLIRALSFHGNFCAAEGLIQMLRDRLTISSRKRHQTDGLIDEHLHR